MVQAALRCGTPVVALSFSCTTPAQVQNKGRREVQNGGGGGGAEGGDGNLEMIAEASFWAAQAHRCGAGTAPILAGDISASGLAKTLRRLTKAPSGVDDASSESAERMSARRIAESMREREDGSKKPLSRALKIINDIARPVAAVRSAAARKSGVLPELPGI